MESPRATAPDGTAGGSATRLVDAVLEVLENLTRAAPALHADSWEWHERSHVIKTLDRVSDLVGVYRSRLLAAHKADGRWASRGDRSFEGYRGRTAGTGFGPARREMELAEGLSDLPQAARAVEVGDVGLAHVGVLTRLHARASEQVKEAMVNGGVDELLAVAPTMDAAAFAKRADLWAAERDTEAVEKSHEQVRRRRYCRISDRDGGTCIEAFVDVVVGASFRAALEALTPVPAADDDRTSEQRRADALAALANRVLDRGADKIGAQIRPHISLIVPVETWAAVRSAGQERGGVGLPPRLAMPELDDGTVTPLSELDRIGCDCEMTRVVLDSEGVPLDVGQTERTYSKALRRAVLVRDRHCRWPGCQMRASWCEVHHIHWFSEGGETSVENALALCAFHHHEVHRRKIDITRTLRGHSFQRPDGTSLGTSERHRSLLSQPKETARRTRETASAGRGARSPAPSGHASRRNRSSAGPPGDRHLDGDRRLSQEGSSGAALPWPP
jgi:hypothetical protein